ncbi:MAG: translocation/assembly module TamB domain-containing protein [Woeseia sp.]
MILRVLKYLLLAVVLLIAVALAGGYWLLETQSGSRWAWDRSTGSVPGNLSARSISGSIGNGLELSGLSYRNETVTVGVADARIAASLVLSPLRLELEEVRADGVVIRQLERPEAEEPETSILEQLALPFEIRVHRLIVTELEVVNSDDETTFFLRRAEAAGTWHEEISLSHVDIDSSAGQLSGEVMLGLETPHPASASFAATYPLTLGETTQLLRFSAEAEGSLENLQVDVSLADPSLRMSGRLLSLLEQPGWDLRLQSSYIQWPLGQAPDQPVSVYLRNADLETAGQLSNYSISGVGLVSVAGQEELPFSLSSRGDSDGIDVLDLDLQGEAIRAAATGEVRWEGGFAVAVDGDISRFDVGILTGEWPEGRPVAGTVDAAWSAGKVDLNELQLRILQTDAKVHGSGQIDVEGGVVDVGLEWRNLQWPLQEKTSAAEVAAGNVESEFGRINVSGSPEDWTFEGRAALKAADLPQGVFELSGHGNRESVEAVLHQSNVLAGSASGRGSFNWAENGRWSVELVTRDLNVGALLPELPGRISSEFAAEGQLTPAEFSVDIERIEGVLRERPIHGEGSVRYAAGNLVAEQLQLNSGESRLLLDGDLASASGLHFELDAPALERFQQELAGSVRAAGNLSLAAEFPALSMELQAHDVLWNGYGVEELTLSSTKRQNGNGLSLQASGVGLSAGARRIESLVAGVEAGPDQQRLELELSPGGEQGLIAIELDGRLEDWKRPLDSLWRGSVEAARLVDPSGTTYQLADPAPLELGTNRLLLDGACLQGQEQSRVCLDAIWSGGTVFSLSAELASVPVELVSLIYETDLRFTQDLSGHLSLTAGEDASLSGEGDIAISPGRVQNRIDPAMATQTGAGSLRFDLADGELLAALALPFSESAEIDAEFEMSDIRSGTDSEISGRLLANLNDISVAATVVPVVTGIRGRLEVDLALAGTLGSPVLAGDASLKNGALRYDPIGLQLTNIELDAVMDEDNRIDIRSTFRAGEGKGEIETTALSLGDLREGLQLSLTGEDLTLVDLPDANVVADANLGIGIQGGSLRLNGNVLVSRARLTPTNLASGKVTESEDVRIVAQEEDEPVEPEGGDGAPFQLFGTVALALGQDVHVDLDVAEARLGGSTAFTWNGPAVPIGNGQYTVDGRFEAYGQLLEITEGRIQFPGTSAANPNLRIRAEREIFGNPQVNSAGVLITGTAQDPEVDVYTNPPSSRDRAVTLLVTGSDFNFEQGVGAVDVGTYIAPDLYISYGIGLFDRENVISLRYDIARGFGIKATSGKKSEGVDLSYTIKR